MHAARRTLDVLGARQADAENTKTGFLGTRATAPRHNHYAVAFCSYMGVLFVVIALAHTALSGRDVPSRNLT